MLSANGADLNHGNVPDEIAKSIARVRKRERVYSLEQKSSSFTVTRYSRISAIWLRHVGDGPAHIDAQKNKEISGVQCCHVRDVITCYTLDDAFNMAIQTINHRLLNSSLQKWHIMQNVMALLISKKRIRDRIFLIINPGSISRKKIRNFKINIIYIYVIFN